MPESPDFDQIARQAISGSEFHIARVAQQLRQVWNARGAADRDLIETDYNRGGPEEGVRALRDVCAQLQGLDR